METRAFVGLGNLLVDALVRQRAVEVIDILREDAPEVHIAHNQDMVHTFTVYAVQQSLAKSIRPPPICAHTVASSKRVRRVLRDVQEYLILVYTLPCDPDANQIEWLWRWSRREVMHNHQRDTFEALKADMPGHFQRLAAPATWCCANWAALARTYFTYFRTSLGLPHCTSDILPCFSRCPVGRSGIGPLLQGIRNGLL